MTTRILQISDLHIGDENKEAENLDIIIEHIIKKTDEKIWDPNNTIIIVTGDITNTGETEEFIIARNAFARLKFQKGYDEILFIPGNHDYGGYGLRKGKVSESKFKDFKKVFGEIFTYFKTIEFPNKKDINGHTIINLDSMKGQIGTTDDRMADGEIGRDQRIKLEEILTDPNIVSNRSSGKKVIVCLHHHPFIFPDDGFFRRKAERIGHALDDEDKLRDVIKGRVDVLVFGHEHKHLDFSGTYFSGEGKDTYEIPNILSCGKSTENGTEHILSENGEIDIKKSNENEKRKFGLFGWLIEIEDNGEINVEIEVFT